jgi:hypothetical protein
MEYGRWEKDKVNIACLRTGFEIGRHELVLDAPLESLTIVTG